MLYMSTLVAFRVPKRLKEEMKKTQNVNWSSYLRSAVEKRLRLEELHRLSREIETIKTKIPPSPDVDFSVKSIREDRGR